MLSERLRALDPEASVEAAPVGGGGAGKYAINRVRYHGHELHWLGEVDERADVEALVKLVVASACGC